MTAGLYLWMSADLDPSTEPYNCGEKQVLGQSKHGETSVEAMLMVNGT